MLVGAAPLCAGPRPAGQRSAAAAPCPPAAHTAGAAPGCPCCAARAARSRCWCPQGRPRPPAGCARVPLRRQQRQWQGRGGLSSRWVAHRGAVPAASRLGLQGTARPGKTSVGAGSYKHHQCAGRPAGFEPRLAALQLRRGAHLAARRRQPAARAALARCRCCRRPGTRRPPQRLAALRPRLQRTPQKTGALPLRLPQRRPAPLALALAPTLVLAAPGPREGRWWLPAAGRRPAGQARPPAARLAAAAPRWRAAAPLRSGGWGGGAALLAAPSWRLTHCGQGPSRDAASVQPLVQRLAAAHRATPPATCCVARRRSKPSAAGRLPPLCCSLVALLHFKACAWEAGAVTPSAPFQMPRNKRALVFTACRAACQHHRPPSPFSAAVL